MRILSGQPGSDLLSPILEAFQQARGAWLIVPTASMGEHLRNTLARQGQVIRPSSITTFAKLIDDWTQDADAATGVDLEWLGRNVLDRTDRPLLERLRTFPGFRRALTSAIEELSAAGGSSESLSPFEEASALHRDLRWFVAEVESECKKRGWLLRHQIMLAAARNARLDQRAPEKLFFAGFYSFTPGELVVIEALTSRAEVTVALPEWSGSELASEAFARIGAAKEAVGDNAAPVAPVIVSAPTLDTEAEEIGRRILEEHAQGLSFREIGIVVRSEDPYVPILRSALERFGIPARFYFGVRLSGHPVTRFLGGLIESMQAGWDHGALLGALRCDGSPLAGEHHFEFETLKGIPDSGLDALPLPADLLARLQTIEDWAKSPAAASAWTSRFQWLTSLYATPPRHVIGRQEALLWRERAGALQAWSEAAQQAARLVEHEASITLSRFWQAMTLCVEQAEIRTPDHRRDVVYVIDAFEARQWRLPVLFVCGLYERHFPQYPTENPIVNDATRLALRSQGVVLRTTLERQQDEKFLFDLICRHAKERLVLSYPRLDAKGNDRLRSFFIRDAAQPEEAIAVHPQPMFRGAPQSHGIRDAELLEKLTKHLERFSVSSIDSFLQCPFVFFTRRTLALQEPPQAPADRFGFRERGTLVHEVLEKVYRDGMSLDQAFEEEFAKVAREANLLKSYRTEALRLAVFDDVQRFLEEAALPPSPGALYEEELELEMEGVLLRGRADRVDFDAQGRAVVIDYKYKAAAGIKDLFNAHGAGRNVQAGLYLRALYKKFEPAGMIFAGLRGGTGYGGWVLPGIAPSAALTQVSTSFLHEEMRKAYDAAHTTITAVRQGSTQPKPADDRQCRWCESSAICRVEEQKLVVIAGGIG